MKRRNNGTVNEKYAFHFLNVSIDHLNEICQNNLDKELTTFNADKHKLGKGIYFYVDPNKCDYYKTMKTQRNYYILFLARILVGHSTKVCVDPNSSLAPKREGSLSYDSTIDETENTICIFDKNKIMLLNVIFLKSI